MQTNEECLTRVIQLFNLLYRKSFIHIIDLENRFIFVGDEMLDVANETRENVIGRTWYDVMSPHPDNIVSTELGIRAAISTRLAQHAITINVKRHETTQRILHVIQKPIINPATDQVVAVHIEFFKVNFPLYFHHLLLKNPERITTRCLTYEQEGILTKDNSRKPFTMLQGILFQWVNPKAWIMAIGVIATFTQVNQSIWLQLVPISIIYFIAMIPSVLFWLLGGAGLSKYLANPKHLRVFNWSMGVLLAFSIITIFFE